MLTKDQIFFTLDHSNVGYCTFVELGHPYTYLIDSRINVLKGEGDNWAIVVEVLGFTPPGDPITLELYYFGNCLLKMEDIDGALINSYRILPVENMAETLDVYALKSNAEYWVVRGQKVKLSHNKQDYLNAGIKLKERKPNQIRVEEAGRLAILNHRDLFRATDEELYKYLLPGLKKLLVIDEWFHKGFSQNSNVFDDLEILSTFDLQNKSVVRMMEAYTRQNDDSNTGEWNNNRPGSYETWQQIAEVIVTGDTSLYHPTLKPNTHWENWLHSGKGV